MYIIESIESSLALLCQNFKLTKNYLRGITYKMNPVLGSGTIKLYGHIHDVYYIEIDVVFKEEHYRRFAVTEEYIEISNNFKSKIALGQENNHLLEAENGINCYVNMGETKLIQHFPAGTQLKFNALVIRSSFLKVLPNIDEKKLYQLAPLIKTGGFNDTQHTLMFEQLKLFPLATDYGHLYLMGKAYETIALLEDKLNQMKWSAFAYTSYDLEILKKAIRYVNTNAHKNLSIPLLTTMFAINKNKLQSGFKVLTGLSVHEYLINIRTQHAMKLLQSSYDNMKTVSSQVGFKNEKSLYQAFNKNLGITPLKYKKYMDKIRSKIN